MKRVWLQGPRPRGGKSPACWARLVLRVVPRRHEAADCWRWDLQIQRRWLVGIFRRPSPNTSQSREWFQGRSLGGSRPRDIGKEACRRTAHHHSHAKLSRGRIRRCHSHANRSRGRFMSSYGRYAWRVRGRDVIYIVPVKITGVTGGRPWSCVLAGSERGTTPLATM